MALPYLFREGGQPLLILNKSDLLLVEMFHLFQGFVFAHEFLKVASALPRGPSCKEGAERFEDSGRPEYHKCNFLFYLEANILEKWSM